MAKDTSFFQKLADWDFNLHDIWVWFRDLFFYYYDTLGWKGVLIFTACVCVFLFFFEPTRYFISLLYNSIVRELIITPIKQVVQWIFAILKYLWDLSISRLRDIFRIF